MITVFHGSIIKVDKPLVSLGRPNLDFGQGFYITDIQKQAERWAIRMGRRKLTDPVLNIYHFDIETVNRDFHCLEFCIINQKIIDEYLHFVESTNI